MITFNPKDIPSEVWKVYVIQYINQPVGNVLYQECLEIINKYPEYFK